MFTGISVCGGLLDHGPLQSGVITSPNYPDAYDNESFCIWLLRAHDGGSVRLHIHYLEGQATREGHCVDFMEVCINTSKMNWWIKRTWPFLNRFFFPFSLGFLNNLTKSLRNLGAATEFNE